MTVSFGDVLTIAIFLAGMAGGLGTLHYRGMLKVAEIRSAFDSRLSALEQSIRELDRSIHANGFAHKSDLERIEEEVVRLRDRQHDFANKLTHYTLRDE